MTKKSINILLVDNYDSFTFNLKNLVQSQENVRLVVRRNDEDFLTEVRRGNYDGAIIGPGPGSPVNEEYFGYNKQLILEHGTRNLPILGVCLGFQGIYHCFNGKLRLGDHPVHGKVSRLEIVKQSVILKGVPQRISVMRYHSIFADVSNAIPDCLDITAYAQTQDGTISENEPMALEHKKFPIFGVQFHPESFATDSGSIMIGNFLDRCRLN